MLAKLALKIYAVAIKALVKFTLFTRHYFVPQIQPRRLLANSIKFKWIRFQRLALVKFVNLILPKPPFQLGFVGMGRIGVVAGLGKRRGCICRAQAPLCVQTSRPDPRPLVKRFQCSLAPADRPLSPRRHRGIFLKSLAPLLKFYSNLYLDFARLAIWTKF